jgi:uncharacterized protein YfcZ (UPF0381/DUF406 family)
MTTDVRKAEIHDALERHHARYEVRPYYVIWDQRPEGAPEVERKVQAGFEVDLYAALEKCQVPTFDNEQARAALSYFESLARDVESAAGNNCTVEVIPSEGSVVLDTHEHFQPEAMLQIRVCHHRGLDQPEGPAEEKALKAIREALHELGVRES